MNHTDNLVLRQIYMMCPNDDKPGGNLPVGGPNASGNGSGTAMSGAGGCGTIENPVELPGAEVEGSGTKTDPPQVPTNPPTYPTPYPTMCPVCRAKLDWGVCSMCGYGASGTNPGWNWGSGNNSGSGSGSGSGYGSGNNSSGGGGTVGGGTSPGTPNNNDKKPEFRNDCPSSAARNSEAVRAVIDNPKLVSAPNHDVLCDIAALRYLATNHYNEHSVSIRLNPDSGQYYSSPVLSGTSNSVEIQYSAFAKVTIHTHPYNQVPAPSPLDIISFVGTARDQKNDKDNGYKINIQAGVIFAGNGSEYVISVDDKNKLTNFINKTGSDASYAGFFKPEGDTSGGFLSGSKWETEYKTAYNNLKDKGKYTQEDAQAHALAYLLDKYDMGLKIAKRKNSNSEFKELKTEKDNKGKYIPQICR